MSFEQSDVFRYAAGSAERSSATLAWTRALYAGSDHDEAQGHKRGRHTGNRADRVLMHTQTGNGKNTQIFCKRSLVTKSVISKFPEPEAEGSYRRLRRLGLDGWPVKMLRSAGRRNGVSAISEFSSRSTHDRRTISDISDAFRYVFVALCACEGIRTAVK